MSNTQKSINYFLKYKKNVLEFLDNSLKPKRTEKKKYGEVQPHQSR